MSRFSKNPEDEDFLLRLNTALSGLESELGPSADERFPTVYVLGLPRSGTTLAVQQIVSGLDVGYINNLIASFWMAPTCGIRLSQKLLPAGFESSFQSEFGRTRSIDEPHEFGYFWSRHLGIEGLQEPGEGDRADVDWASLKHTIVGMCETFDRPIVFKNFFFAWYAEQILDLFERAIVVYVSRDPMEVAMSLLRMREEFFGSKEAWASLRPKEYSWLKDEPYWVQVAGQVHFLDLAFREAKSLIPGDRIIETTLGEIREMPNEFVDRVAASLKDRGFEPARLRRIPAEFSRKGRSPDDSADYARVEAAMIAFRDGLLG